MQKKFPVQFGKKNCYNCCMRKEVFVVIETVLDRDDSFPVPRSRCMGVFGDKDSARLCVNQVYEECCASYKSCLYDAQPLSSEDDAYVIPVDGNGFECYWRIDSVECQSLFQ